MPRIVIVSFGLRRHTRDSLDRLRRTGHPLHLVAAMPAASRGLRTHRSRLVTVEDGHGRAALRAALAGADDDPVLLVHEDVLLAPDAAQRLLDVAAGPGSPIAVPSTNHRDVDTAVGPLPPDVVQPLGDATEPLPVQRFRAACVAATGWRLAQLTRHRLTAAASRLELREEPVLWVRDAVATHLDRGRDVLEPPTGPDDRPLLVASMIVRDEEELLPGCLSSLASVVDRIDVCDTGSTDGTITLAREAGAEVLERPWTDDFAAARNHALARSRDAWWVLQIDADERLRVDDPEHLRRVLATAVHDGEAFEVPLRNLTEEGEVASAMHLTRLFRPDGVAYHGAVHEVPRRLDGRPITWTVTTELQLDHLGYQRRIRTDRDKGARNLRIARAGHEHEGSPTTALQLARSLALTDQGSAELTALLEDLYAGLDRDGLSETARVTVHRLYANALAAQGRVEEAYAIASAGLEHHPASSVLRATHAGLAVATERFAEVAGRADDERPTATRAWQAPIDDARYLLELATSQLATDDADAAAATVEQVLRSPVLGALDRWTDVVTLVAMTMAPRASDVLRGPVAADRTGDGLRAVATVFHPEDAAAFAVEVAGALDDPSTDQVVALEDVVVASGDTRLLARLLDTFGPGEDLPDLDLDATLTTLAAGGDVDRGTLVAYLAADRSNDALRRLVRDVAPAVAAPIAAAGVEAGARSDAALRIVLAVVTVAGDVEAAETIAPYLGDLDTEVLDTVLQRAAGRGASDVAGVVARTLLARSAGASQGTS